MSNPMIKHGVVSVTDGNVYDFDDDSCENVPGSFGEKRPKQRRQILEAALRKTLKDGTPVYYAGTRTTDKDGNFVWGPAELQPAFPGDYLPKLARPLTPEVIKLIKANLAKRADVNRASLAVQGAEFASFMERVVKAAALPAPPEKKKEKEKGDG